MSAAAVIGKSVADFELELAGGETTRLKALCSKHDLVVLDFYTAWCKACPEVAKKID